MLVYHGSTVQVDHPISAACRPNLDFGKGFYLTDIREQAERWACRAANRDKQQWLNIYSLDIDKVRAKYTSLRFSSYDDAWLDFIMACRKGEDVWTEYDFIEGGSNRRINANESLLQMKYARIVDGLMERLRVNRVHALDVFYMSETYQGLVDKKGDLHCMSDAYLIDEIVLEVERNQGN